MMDLEAFDGRDVRRTTIAITGAGDGLSEALALDPQQLHIGDRVFVVVEAKVRDVRFKPIKDTEDLQREHVAVAAVATLVDEPVVREVLDQQIVRLLDAKKARDGQERFDIEGTNGQDTKEKSLVREHAEGLHIRKRKACPLCQRPADKDANVTQIRRRGPVKRAAKK